MYKKICLYGGIVLAFGAMCIVPVQASDVLVVTADGCFNNTTNTTSNTYHIRMQTPACTLTIQHTGSSAETPIFLIENVDPDFVTVNNYDTETGFIKTTNSLQFSKTIQAGTTETITIEPWHEYGDDFYFVALSDNQAQGTIDVNPVFETIIQELNVVNPVFYTNSGDLVQGSSNRETMQQMYDSVIDALELSTAPMYPIAGNHDYGSGLDVFSEYFGVDDYSFDFGNTRFTGVSTVGADSMGEVDDDTFAWLDSILATNEKTHSIVFFHHPLVRPEWSNNTYCCYLSDEDREEFAGILDSHNTDITINGHSHGYDYRFLTSSDLSTITNGFYQLITGGAGGSIAQPDGKHHFTIVHVTPDSIEHTVVYKNEFDTSVEYSDNSPTSSKSTAEVLNEDEADLPYARLKFTLSSDFDRYVVYSSEGDYLDTVYYKQLDNYTVIYAEIAPEAGSAVTYTAQAATQIHTGLTNTVEDTGLVSYDAQPERVDTVVPLTVVPNSGTTEVSNVTWGDETNNYLHAWRETPSQKKLNTTYSISELPSNRLFEISVNGELYNRVATNTNGELEFTYTPTKSVRDFTVHMLDTLYSDVVATAPYSGGNPQIRRFNGTGDNVSSWFALNASQTGSYNIGLADVTGDREHELIVSSGENTGGTVAVYTKDGEKLAQTKPFGDTYADGITIYHGNVTGDDAEELFFVANSGVATIKAYRYNVTTGKLKHLSTNKPFGTSYTGTIRIAIGNLNTNTTKEIAVVATDSAKAKVKLYKINSQKKFHTITSKHLKSQYSHASVVIGEFTAPGAEQLLLYLSDASSTTDQIKLYSLNNSNRLRQLSKTSVESTISGNVDVLPADIDANFTDDLIAYSEFDSTMEVYKINSQNTVKHRMTMHPFGSDYKAGLDVTTIDADNNWDTEIVTSQLAEDSRIKVWNYRSKSKSLHKTTSWRGYAENFSGGTRLAK